MKNFYTLLLLLLATVIASAQVSYSFTSQTADYQTTTKQSYKVVSSSKANGFTEQIGAPQLPVFTKRLVLPAGSVVTNVVVNNQSQALLNSNIYLYPSQPERDWISEPAFVPTDPAVYNSSTAYPTNTVVKSGDNDSQGYHIITLDICPFKYLPSQRKLYLYQTVNITVQYTIGNIEKTEKITQRRQNLTKEWVASQVENPALLNTMQPTAKTILNEPTETDKSMLRWKPSAYQSYIPDYIIITNEALKPKFQQLADYKTKRGIPTLIVTTEQIYPDYPGVDNAEKIRNYLKAARKFWGHGLFVLLGGDIAIVPERIGSYNHQSTDGPSPSDLYYCDVYKEGNPNYNWNQNGNTKFGETGDGIESGLSGDNFIGRAPVDTEQEAQNFATKVMNYEKLDGVPSNKRNYVNNMLFLGSYLHHINSYPHTCIGGQEWHDDLADESFLVTNSNLKNWQLYDDYQGSSDNPNYLGNEELDKINTLNRMNNGESSMGKFHLVSHYDHGGPFGVGASSHMKSNSLSRQDMDALSNGNYLQIMYTTACLPGKFTLDAFAEHYINNPNGGGVAILANTESVGAGIDYAIQDKKLFQSIYGKNEYEISTNAYLMGFAFANARDALTSSQRRKVFTLFGDPTMATWSATPGTITLTTPTSLTISNTSDNTLTVGQNALTNEATLTLYKFNTITGYPEVLTVKKVPAGSTSTVFNLNPDTTGQLLVQATAKNYLPATKNVNILMPQTHLYITGYTFNDANANGLIEQGESITLNINLTNSGGTAINNITTTLSCLPELTTITNASVNHSATVNPGQTIQLNGYTFSPLVEMGVDEIPDFIEFHLDITGSGNLAHNDNFYLDLFSPALNLGARALTNNSGNPTTITVGQEVNAKIAINNSGNVATGTLNATLSSDLVGSGTIQIITPTSNYNSIGINSEEENTTHFKFKLLQAHSGAMPFTLTLTNAFGQSWDFEFDMNEQCPGLITGFNFTSSSNQINLMWNPVTNIGGYNIYRSDSENGTYEKINDYIISGSSTYTDYEVEQATQYYYKISVVSTSGNECPLETIVTQDNPPKQGYLAWTSLEQHGSFPVPAYAKSGVSSPILYDTNGDGTKEIFVNYRQNGDDAGLIMGFEHDGEEIFDIDGNPTTISGFAVTDAGIWANSAVGDIDGDGFVDVVSVSRDNNSNRGKLYAYKTIDTIEGDNNDQPDPFWENEIIDFGHRIGYNPVLYDLNNDGFLEIIVATENQKVYVYDKNKNLMPGWPIQISGGNDYSYGHIAVADLDHDGFGEIAFGVEMQNGTKGAIYIWNYDGTTFTTNPFKEFANNERADSGITFADIDNDGEYELLTTTKTSNSNAKIYAFHLNGNPVNAAWNGQITFSVGSESILPRISVGDLDNNSDGKLEVVFGTQNKLYVLKADGTSLLPGTFPKTVADSENAAPILADIDGDANIEIILNAGGKIIAFNPDDGTPCIGWNLQSNNGSPFRSSPSIDDIDDDGLNEIVVSTEDCTTYVWDTEGDANRIEWGLYRADSYNTGTYKKGCLEPIDLYIKDGTTDLGIEPNTFTEHMWVSEDIWIRNNNDNGLEHQNPEYRGNGQPNFIKIRIINKGCEPTTGTETLTMNWAKASTNLQYPQNWNGTLTNGTYPLGGQIPGTPITIPVIQPGEEFIMTVPWIVPNPDHYLSGAGSENPWHFCLLATILGTSDPLTHPYTSNPNTMVRENNNQAWKNLTVVDLVNDFSTSISITGAVAISNPNNAIKNYSLELIKEPTEGGQAIYDEAEVTIRMDSILYSAWERGGEIAQNIEDKAIDSQKLVKANNVVLDNINFNANDYGLLYLDFNFLTKKLTDKTKFTYHVIQRDKQTGEVVGGETFVIKKKQRDRFDADAGDDVEVSSNQAVTLSAESINEPAVYNWYDSQGNFIYQGQDLEIPSAIAETYRLEVISDIDGFKDYDEVSVTLRPSTLDQIAPNPASNNVTVTYTLNNVSSAHLRVQSYYENVAYNYPLDANNSQVTFNVSTYNTGFYVVSLVCDGQVVDSKTLIKQ